jgi:hypothetical protein
MDPGRTGRLLVLLLVLLPRVLLVLVVVGRTTPHALRVPTHSA